MKKVKRLIQQILGLKVIKATLNTATLFMAKLFSATYLLSVPYNWLVFFPFMREQRAVLAGKKRYYANLTAKQLRTRVTLRRNTHRLEKGLLMRPRRASFAREYILETVKVYKKAAELWTQDKDSYDESELNWAHNVLDQYFKNVTIEGVVKRAQEIFAAQAYQPTQDNMYPYKRAKQDNLPSYESMLALSMHRRSVRWFQKKAVSRQDIDEALLVARQSPTACNRLPYEFKIFDDPKLVKQVANTPFGTGGYADNIPVIAVLVGKLGSYFSARDRHAIYVDSSLAAMSFAFALETKGISTCMINWPDFEPLEHKMQKMLGLGFDERPIMLIAIGYADPEGLVAYSQKKSLDNIRSYNGA